MQDNQGTTSGGLTPENHHFLPHAGLSGPGRLQSRESIGALIRALEARDPYTGEHSRRVTAVACQFAVYLSLPSPDVDILRTAGQLHDLGKVGIKDAILLKPGSFTPDEREIIKTHPAIRKKIVEPLGLRAPEQDLILHHHERWDGRGYPGSLAGDEIPFLCQILALADCFDAITTDRPYRRGCDLPKALSEIQAGAGSQFNPFLARRFVAMASVFN